jgi:isopenicillin N synthase-like dioxygenase
MAEASVLGEGGGLPVLDFSAWREGRTQADRSQVAKTLVDVCRRVGFVYITNHGLPAELVEEAFGWTHKLFALDQDKKMLAPHPDGAKVHRGYSWPGLEKVSQQASEKEDPELASLLRQTTDHKVWHDSLLVSPVIEAILTNNLESNRRAMRLAVRRTPSSPTCGYRRMSCRGFGHSPPAFTGSATGWRTRYCLRLRWGSIWMKISC